MAALNPEQFQQALARAGISDDKPLHPILTTIYETAIQAREIVGTGARGLSPSGEKELISRVAASSAEATQHEVERLVRRIGWKNAGLMALVGLALLGAGYLWGSWRPTGFLGQVAALNDQPMLARYCEAHTTAREGGTVCSLPAIWITGATR